METRELTCIQCPLGCQLTVTVDGDSVTVTGNTCQRGAVYGEKEVKAPTRTVTGTVPVDGGEIARVSVKTASDIPKDKMFEVMAEIHAARLAAPVEIGQIIIHDAAGSGADVIATKTVRKSRTA
ncbi:MAG: DUF1667 domain-containing protein [Oscillospiraceae bacterium]|nr:DUF1667 domain-containing protein [Oscillospiraceae bacterium]